MELHADELRSRGVQATTLYSDDAWHARIGPLDQRVPGVRLLAAQWQRLRREQPDVINVHTRAAPAFLLARRLGLIDSRIVVMSYAADERALAAPHDLRSALDWGETALPARALIRDADGIWCVSQQDAAFWRDACHVEARRVRVIPHAVAEVFFHAPPVARDLSQLLFVGTWIARKGVDVLQRALQAIVVQRPDVRIVLAGVLTDETEVRAGFSQEAERRLTVYARVDDDQLVRLYAQSGLLILPSRLEGLPFALLEAMACGCPALAAAHSGMLDVVEHGRNGWLIDGHDPLRWAERIRALLAQPHKLATASTEARRTAQRFHASPLSARALAWYAELCA